MHGEASKPSIHPLHGQLARDNLPHGRVEVEGAEGSMAPNLTDSIDRKSSCCDQVARHGLLDPIGLVLATQSKYGSIVIHIASTTSRGIPTVHIQEHAARRLFLHHALLQAVIEKCQGRRIVHLIANRLKFTILLSLRCLLLVRTLNQRVKPDGLVIAAKVFRRRSLQFVLEELRLTNFRGELVLKQVKSTPSLTFLA